jgi:hypothetical protein
MKALLLRHKKKKQDKDKDKEKKGVKTSSKSSIEDSDGKSELMESSKMASCSISVCQVE